MDQAISISSAVLPLVCRDGFSAHILASFPKACNLITADGQVVALVTRSVGDGPLNIVVDEADFRAWPRAWPVRGDGSTLVVAEGRRIRLTGAAIWQPMPDYAALARRGKDGLPLMWARLDDLLAARAPRESLARLRADNLSPSSLLPHQRLAQGPVTALRSAYADGNPAAVATQAAALAGLGPGLTPAGDDWLAGWLIGLRLWEAVHPHAARRQIGEIAAAVVRAAAGRTHPLSLALLRAAGEGQVSAPWHALLDSVADHDLPRLETAVERILNYGETSGADMLAGFLSAFPGKAHSVP